MCHRLASKEVIIIENGPNITIGIYFYGARIAVHDADQYVSIHTSFIGIEQYVIITFMNVPVELHQIYNYVFI